MFVNDSLVNDFTFVKDQEICAFRIQMVDAEGVMLLY